MRSLVPAFCAALATAGATALSAAPPAPQAAVSKGTLIRVRLETDLRSGGSKAGEPVLFTVDQNVYGSNHVLLLEKGALARGHVTDSAGHGAFGRAGKLTFTCDYARADDGTHIPLSLSSAPQVEGGGSTGELAASVSTGAHGYYPALSPYGYGYPGGYEQQAGVAAGVSVDPGRIFGNGADVTASRGQEYDATVTADTPLVSPSPSVPSSQQLFTLQDKTQVVGTLVGFDGKAYTLETLAGRRSLRAADVRSIQAMSLMP